MYMTAKKETCKMSTTKQFIVSRKDISIILTSIGTIKDIKTDATT